MDTNPPNPGSRAADSALTRSTTRGGYAAAFIICLFWAWISPPYASAQGSLIVTMTSPSSGSLVGGTITVSVTVSDPGRFKWLATFANGRFGVFASRVSKCRAGQVKLKGKCRRARITFGKGTTTVTKRSERSGE